MTSASTTSSSYAYFRDRQWFNFCHSLLVKLFPLTAASSDIEFTLSKKQVEFIPKLHFSISMFDGSMCELDGSLMNNVEIMCDTGSSNMVKVELTKDKEGYYEVTSPPSGTYTISFRRLLSIARHVDLVVYVEKFDPDFIFDSYGRTQLPKPGAIEIDMFTLQLEHSVTNIHSNNCYLQYVMKKQGETEYQLINNPKEVFVDPQERYEICYYLQSTVSDLRTPLSQTLYCKPSEMIQFWINRYPLYLHRSSLGIWFPSSSLMKFIVNTKFLLQLYSSRTKEWQWYDCEFKWNTIEICVGCTELLEPDTDYSARLYIVFEDFLEQVSHTRRMFLIYDSTQFSVTTHIPALQPKEDHLNILKDVKDHSLAFRANRNGFVSTLEVYLDGFFDWTSDLLEPSNYTFHVFGQAEFTKESPGSLLLWLAGSDQVSGEEVRDALKVKVDEDQMITTIFNRKRMIEDYMICTYIPKTRKRGIPRFDDRCFQLCDISFSFAE